MTQARSSGSSAALDGEVDVADLIEGGGFVAVVVVAGEHLEHRGDGRGAHDAGVLAERVLDDDAFTVIAVRRKPDLVVVFGADEGVGRDLVKPLCEQGAAEKLLELLDGGVAAVGGAADGGDGDLVVAVEPRDLLSEVGLVREVGAEGGRDDEFAVDPAFEAGEDAVHLLDRHLDAEEAVDPVGLQLDAALGVVGIVHVDHAADDLARAEQLDELAGAFDRRDGGGGVELLFKAAGRLGAHAELFGGGAHRRAVEAGRLEDDHVGVVHDAAVFAAHDARDGGGLLRVRDDEHLGGEDAVDPGRGS